MNKNRIFRHEIGMKDKTIFEEALRNCQMRGLDSRNEWIPVSTTLPIERCLLKTKSGLVIIGDLYDGKWRVDGHWRHNGSDWISDYKFRDIVSWRDIP